MRPVLGQRFGLGATLPHRGNLVRAVAGGALIPCTHVYDVAVEFLPEFGFLLRPQQGKCGAAHDRHFGAAHQFQQAKGVRHLLITPGVAGDHGDPQDVHIWRLKQDEDGHHVRPTWSGRVLVDDDVAFVLREQAPGEQDGADADQDLLSHLNLVSPIFIFSSVRSTSARSAPGRPPSPPWRWDEKPHPRTFPVPIAWVATCAWARAGTPGSPRRYTHRRFPLRHRNLEVSPRWDR